MARLVSSKKNLLVSATVSTVFEDGTVADHSFKEGDVLEGLRYIENEEIVTVSGKVKSINYTLPSKASWKAASPSDTLSDDIVLSTLVLDASEQYESKLITVPFDEIVEWEDEKNVARMLYGPKINFTMEMYYSDRSIANIEISVGDEFDEVLILNPKDIPNPYTGYHKVIALGYTINRNVLTITSIAFENEQGKVIVADLEYILKLNEVFTYLVDTPEQMAEVIEKLADGDTINVASEYDTTAEGAGAIVISKQNVKLAVAEDIITANSANTGVQVTGGSVTVTGSGLFRTNTPYGTGHASGVFAVRQDGEAVFNGSGIYTVIEDDPENKGQFGITCYRNTFTAGWFVLAGNGNAENNGSVMTINGGTLISKTDYAVYHPCKGKLVINGGYIEGPTGAVAVNNGDVEITGGTLSTLGLNDNTSDTGDGTAGMVAAALNLHARYGEVNCTISGGIFKSTGQSVMINTGSTYPVNLTITGGKFSSKPNVEWIADGYYVTAEPDEDGFYEVKKIA